jgi:hypothetical protein
MKTEVSMPNSLESVVRQACNPARVKINGSAENVYVHNSVEKIIRYRKRCVETQWMDRWSS